MKKSCSVCGKDLSKWNMDFNREIICDSCVLGQVENGGNKVRTLVEETDMSAVKKLYDAICKREITNVAAIACLERTTGHDFKDTKDFKIKMEQFIAKHYYRGEDLQKARKWAGHSHSELAELFEVSTSLIKHMEKDKKPLSQDAIDFIKVMGFKKTVPIKIKKREKSDRIKIDKKIEAPCLKFESDSDWEKWWWEKLNPKCLDCQKDCKQSSNVEIGYCPQFRTLKKATKEDKMTKSEKISDFSGDFVSG
jgi:DNA-binding transcriptional regulator YiaG